MKKLTSLFLILVLFTMICSGAFAHSGNLREDGGHFQRILIKEEVSPEVPEKFEFTAEEKSNNLSGSIKNKVTLSALDYSIVIFAKIGDNEIKLGTGEGALEEKEGEQTIKVTYKALNQEKTAEFIFTVKKNITQEFVPAKFENVAYVLNYHYHRGNFKSQKIKFYPDKKILWNDRDKFYNENAPFLVEEKPEEPKPEEPTEPEEPQQPAQPQENQQEENKTILSGSEGLPKTGETENTIFFVIGVILVSSAAVWIGISKFKILKENE